MVEQTLHKKNHTGYFYLAVMQKSSVKNQAARLNANHKIIQFETAIKRGLSRMAPP